MNLYPAIDLYQGKVVRLQRGDFNQETVYSEHPEEIAAEWERQGAQWIHVVDLEGAKTGVMQNLESVKKIRAAVKCHLQFGGGMRTLEGIESVLQQGIDRVVVGTKALDEAFLKQVLSSHGKQIAIGLDVNRGFVQLEGWAKKSMLTLEAAMELFNKFHIETLIYTDIQKDGMLQGPNFFGVNEVLDLTGARVILSGGVGAIEDIAKACDISKANFEGVIIGKALYEKKFTLKHAIALTQ